MSERRGRYVFSGARTFLSAAACEPQHGVESPLRRYVSRCCGQECPRSGLNRYTFSQVCAGLARTLCVVESKSDGTRSFISAQPSSATDVPLTNILIFNNLDMLLITYSLSSSAS